MVHRKALPSQQDVKTPVAEAPTLMGQRSQLLPQCRVGGTDTALSSARTNRPACPPLAHIERGTRLHCSTQTNRAGSGRLIRGRLLK
jgi:hypothetical protein